MSPRYFLVSNASSGAPLSIIRAEDEAVAIACALGAACAGDIIADRMVMHEMVATVTARGADSRVPGRPDAVDFDVHAGDVTVGVTLLVDPASGQLDVWGPYADHWCADAKQARRDFGAGWEAAVVAVCRAAA